MKEIIATKDAPEALGPYSQATAHNGTLYISGQIPIDPATGELCTGSFAEQTTRSMKNVIAIARAAGADAGNILKTTILLTDIGAFAEVNEAYAKFFSENPPARACYQVAALPKGANVEIEAVCAL
jgi:2-iminobutanoate/2-iminopropanoate deaminase